MTTTRFAAAIATHPNRPLEANYSVYEQAKKWDKSRSWLKWWDSTTGREVATFAAVRLRHFPAISLKQALFGRWKRRPRKNQLDP
jgi:hypothetical protein